MHSLNRFVEPTFPVLAPKLGLSSSSPSGGHMHATHSVPRHGASCSRSEGFSDCPNREGLTPFPVDRYPFRPPSSKVVLYAEEGVNIGILIVVVGFIVGFVYRFGV